MNPEALDMQIDDTLDAYDDWREECAAVELAYRRWSTAPADGAALAFAIYVAALDREQRASNVYARLVARNHGRYAGLQAPEPSPPRDGPDGLT